MTLRPFLLSVAVLLAACAPPDPMDDPEYAAACHGPPLRTPEAREAAQVAGHVIHRGWDCIDRESYEALQRYEAQMAKERAERAAQARAPNPSVETLTQAREEFETSLGAPATADPVPMPPADQYVRSDYSLAGGKHLAFVTPDPGDGQEHPAIVWLTGGDTNTLSDFWVEGEPANDPSASPFRKAGIVVMFPTLRGGNGDSRRKEFFLGEVDDVLAAANHLARLPYVDADRIYLGGHSTGGTLALLVAETGGRFAAVFVFGAVTSADRYHPPLVPDFGAAAKRELALRSPIHWLDGIGVPVYLIEGEVPPGNADELETLCAKTRNPLVHCIPAAGFDHFSVLWPVSRQIAARIAVGVPDGEPVIRPQQFARGATNGE
jgi:pimeloyl-ACP methyl ester carboxylesterase